MAWLSGLAGKAENLLNKIDQNTAAVLNKDKYDASQPQLSQVTWIPSQPCFEESQVTNPTHTLKNSMYVHSAPNLCSVSPMDVHANKEDELLFLNTPDVSPKKLTIETSPPTPSSLLVEHPTDNTDSVSEISIHSGTSSPRYTHKSVDVTDNEYQVVSEQIHEVDPLIRNEIHEPNTQFIQSSAHNDFKEESDKPQNNFTYELYHRNMEINNYINSVKDQSTERHLNQTNVNFGERKLIEKQETDYQKEITLLKERLELVESDKSKFLRQIAELQCALDKSRMEVSNTRSELDQHRARALRTLQEKEKLILELKSKTTSSMDDAVIMEFNQLRQERDSLREENQQMCEQLKIVRGELCNADLKLEKMRQQSAEANIQAQEILGTERRRRLDVEEDARLHSEEIRSLKDELLCQRNRFTSQFQKQEAEISRLRLQLSAASTPNSEVESRLASLTQMLVSKQQALESLTTERNALRLQLEKIEHEFRNAIGNSRRNVCYNNDTDDAKAQVPTFLIETPFDTGVTRRVKRAYSSLDAISIRTGVFLRRYPLARILVLIYMALLQFWVVLVLLSQSPDAQ